MNDSLGHLRRSLQDAERAYDSALSSHDDEAETSKQDRQVAVSRLLYALLGHEVALSLRPRTATDDIASELATLFRRIRNGDFVYDHYRPLVKLVIDQKPDLEIWSAVFDLTTTLHRVTPPASVPAGLDDTPVTHTSASQQGAEQSRKLVEQRLFEEIKHCLYRSVEGFVEKHFEGKDWTSRALEIYKKIKDRHRDGRWTDFPDPPMQDGVVDWWFQFQDEFLSNEQHRYYKTSSSKELTGAEARRQIDLFVKRNKGGSETVHDLKDVKVIGELKQSNRDKKGTFLQISRYVRDIFSCQPTRRYVPAFTLCGREMEVWIFDRSGPYGPGPFDIHDEPERFIRVIVGYLMMDDEELGLDTFTQQDSAGRFITLEQGDEKLMKLRLEPSALVYQRAIVCRGTSCFLAKTPNSESHNCVAKFSWTSDRRRPEVDLLSVACQRGVKGIANLIGHQKITTIAEMRSGLMFGNPYSFRGPHSVATSSQSFSQSQQPSFVSGSFNKLQGLSITQSPPGKRKSVDVGRKPSKRSRSNSQRSSQQNKVAYAVEEAQETSLFGPDIGPYDNRAFRCLVVSPAGRPIRKHESPLELLEAFCDAIKAHKSLYLTGNILHRDISENNIIITDPKKDGFHGMLIDLDLAKELGSGRSGARCRTGTMEFMAIEVLLGIAHTYRHDLESFFYVLIWLCGCRGWDFAGRTKDRPEDSILIDWYTGTFRNIATAKRGHMQIDGFEVILDEFPQPEFDYIKPLCKELRGILFPYREGLFVGTPRDPEVLYEPILRAFDKAIDTARAREG